MTDDIKWKEATGSCGFNIGERAVVAAYVNGVALFVFPDQLSGFVCVVTGQMSCYGKTLEAAKAAGIYQAVKWGTLEADRHLSRKKFQEIIQNPGRLF